MKQTLFCRKNKKKSAFSLIELSIVLIIIGLLIAGVTGGASLIKSSELRAIMSEARSFATAVNGFYNQFNYLPGDYGTAIGGSSAGNGDGTIQYAVPTANTNEGRTAWYQMKGAGTIDSSIIASAITTTAASTVPAVTTFGLNVPASKIKSSGWDFDYNATTFQNVVVLTGAIAAGSTTDTLVNGTFKSTAAIAPTDALSIDAKIDDGVANNGKVRGVLSACFSTTTYTTATTTRACALSYQVDINS